MLEEDQFGVLLVMRLLSKPLPIPQLGFARQTQSQLRKIEPQRQLRNTLCSV